MKTRIMIKNLGLGLVTIFLMMLSVTGYSQACTGNMVAVTLGNFSQTSTTVEFDVYLANTSSNTMRFSTASINVLHSAGMLPAGATGTVSVAQQPTDCDFAGYPTHNADVYNPLARNIRIIGAPNASGQVTLTSTPKKFCRLRLTSSLPWTQSTAGQFTINPTNLTNPTRSATQVTIYCNGNGNSATLQSPGTLTLGGPYTYNLNDVICATSGSANVTNAACFGGTGSATITMSPTPTNASITYTGAGSGSATLSSGSFTISGLAAGTYSVVVSSSGCSSVTVPVTVTEPSQQTSSSTIAACDSYTWSAGNGTTYTESGDYTYTNTSGACPVLMTLHLTINHSTASSQTVSACDSYTWSANGTTYTTSGTYTSTSTNASGCPDVKTLVLTINHSTSSTESATACDSYTWSANGTTYTQSGTYTSTSTNASGCPDTKTLVLTINHSTSSTETATACDSYTWHGTTYTTSGSYTYTSTNASGCPDVKTLVLTINNSTSSTETATACDSYTWHGTTYTTSGSYTYTSTNASGCPDVKTLVLTINNSTSSSQTVSACDSYTWSANGQTYTASGTYTSTGTNASGCPDVKTLVLTINSSTSTTQTVAACDSYTWSAGNGQTYTASGTYTSVSTNHSGCPLTKTLVLTINSSSTTEESATACNNYTWSANNTNYTASGDYFYSTTNPTTGCTIDRTLHLTINNSTSSSETQVACGSYTWPVNNTTYTESGTYTFVGTNASGCVDTKTLNLTINNTTITTQPASTFICGAVGSTASISVATSASGASYQWQYRVVTAANPNPTWLTIPSTNAAYSGSTTATLGITRVSTSSPVAGTQYRVIVTGECGSVTSDAASLSIILAVKAGKIASLASVCIAGDITFTLSGYVGTSIQWQSSPISTTAAPGVWTDIAGATGTTYTLTGATATSNRSYRAIVFSSCNNTQAITATKTIKIDPTSVGGTATGGGTVCSSGGSGTLKVAGNVGKIQWEYSLDGGQSYASAPSSATASTVSGFSTTSTSSIAATYLVTNITVPVQFRARITSGLCSSAYSNVVSYVLASAPTAGTISSAATAPLCPGTGTTLTISGNVGTVQWQKSTNGGSTWTNVVGTTTYNTGNLAATASYRAMVTIGGTCGTLPTNTVVVDVKLKPVAKAPVANVTSPTGATTATAICTNASVVKVLTIAAGYVGSIQWQSSTDGTNYSDISGQTGVSYTVTNPVAGANYYRAKFSNGCTEVIGTAKIVYYKDCGAKANDAVISTPFAVVAYPNPYSENFNLSLTTSSEERVGIVVYDMTGRLIDQREVSADQVSEQKIGDRYPSGVYNVIVTQGKEVKTLRVIKR